MLRLQWQDLEVVGSIINGWVECRDEDKAKIRRWQYSTVYHSHVRSGEKYIWHQIDERSHPYFTCSILSGELRRFSENPCPRESHALFWSGLERAGVSADFSGDGPGRWRAERPPCRKRSRCMARGSPGTLQLRTEALGRNMCMRVGGGEAEVPHQHGVGIRYSPVEQGQHACAASMHAWLG